MRLFAAIFPPTEVSEKCAQIGHALKSFHSSAILVKPEKMHLTLNFFGDVSQEEAEAVIEEGLKDQEAFDVVIDHVDGLPLRKKARVIYCGVESPSPLPGLMKAMGHDRPRAHLTIARLPSPRTVKHMDLSPVTFRADKVVLVNSVLGEGGAYEILREWDLA